MARPFAADLHEGFMSRARRNRRLNEIATELDKHPLSPEVEAMLRELFSLIGDGV